MLKTCLQCGVEFEGSAQARFHSDSCRKAHARQVDPSLPETQVAESRAPEWERPVLSISEEAYVAQALRNAEVFSDSIGESDEPFEFATGEKIANRRSDRIERVKRYARWRYRGVLSGEVASL